MTKLQRGIIIVLDSVGIGAMPDAQNYGDEYSFTLKHVAETVTNFSLPNLKRMGLGNITAIPKLPAVQSPYAFFGKMAIKSPGKDTTTGHWELAGTVLECPFPTYPEGFPAEIIEQFEFRIGREILGNYAASGTQIIKDLGHEHLSTGKPIVYTSADSVFQIAAHENVIPPEELYQLCKEARHILKGEHGVARVIARPFIGEYPNFTRTARRKDFSLGPPPKNMLNLAKKAGLQVETIGKVDDIFAGFGITSSTSTKNNTEGIDKTLKKLQTDFKGILFTNLIDFDMLYGHRNDPQGYFKALLEFDTALPSILNHLKSDDFLIITADHGCDPLHPGTDHTREYVPLLVYNPTYFSSPVDLGTRESLADLGQTVSELLEIGETMNGKSFAKSLFR